MPDVSDLDAWKSLFRAEQKGKSPGEVAYKPVEGIQVIPYSSYQHTDGLEFPHQDFNVSHSLMVDPGKGGRGISDESLDSYQWDFMEILSKDKDPGDDWLRAHRMTGGKADTVEEREEWIFVVDPGEADVLDRMKNGIVGGDASPGRIALKPGDDFIWNVALCRGLYKYITGQKEGFAAMSFSECSVYIPLDEMAPEEDQLIVWTSRILSMMVGGISHYMWDVRNATSWQVEHFNYLLNIPEILAREGKVLVDADPLRGSAMWEELSDRVVGYLQK